MGKDKIAKKIDSTGIPKALNVTQLSVVKFLQAISFANAIIINIKTQIYVKYFHPISVSLIPDDIISLSGCLPIAWNIIKAKATIKLTTVGLILMKVSSWKIKVSAPKNITAIQPKAAKIGTLLSKIQEIETEIIVDKTRTDVPQKIP